MFYPIKKNYFYNFNDIFAVRRPLIFSIMKMQNKTHVQKQALKPSSSVLTDFKNVF